tara:strand:+ start:14322 stop:15596 length:1275 start_codon:yes stop_codon:yes gene_type:complete
MSKKEEVMVEEPVKETKLQDTTNEPPKQEGSFKVKKILKPKQLVEEKIPDLIKVDLTKKTEKDAVPVEETRDVAEDKQAGDMAQVDEQVQDTIEDVTDKKESEEIKEETNSPLQLITDEGDDTNKSGMAGSDETSTTAPKQEEVLQETETQKLPENIEKLIKFMEETGGDVQDYARLNADYTNVNNDVLLHEYYKQAKPHLNAEERNFIIEDSFQYDSEIDDERDVKKKKLAYKEEVAKAKNYLEDLKTKYYDEIKLRPGITQDQQKANDFFNRYNEEQKARKASHERFVSETKNLLNEEFKGFDFKLGEKKFRYGIKDPSSVAQSQSDISNFIKTFLNEKGDIADAPGYHKALFAARNADTIANHFYEQGKTDALKEQMAKSKNITTEPRKTSSGELFVNGLKVKAISGVDSSKLKIKRKTFN